MFSKTCATKTYRRSRKHHINECETRPWLWSGSDVIEGTVSTWAPTKGQSLFLHPQKQGHLEKEKKKKTSISVAHLRHLSEQQMLLLFLLRTVTLNVASTGCSLTIQLGRWSRLFYQLVTLWKLEWDASFVDSFQGEISGLKIGAEISIPFPRGERKRHFQYLP